MDVNKLVTKMEFAGMKSAFRMFEQMTNRMRRDSQRAATGAEDAHAKSARRSAEHWQKSAAKASGAYQKAFAKLKNIKLPVPKMPSLGGMLPGLALAGGAGLAGKGIFDAGKEYESLNAALVTVLGSQKKANTEFERLADFAKKTPYNLNEVIKGFITLKSLNLRSDDYAMTQLGNIAGARSIPIQQVIEAVSDAATFDFERVKEAFKITYKQLDDVVEFTDPLTKTKTRVKKDAQEIQKYLLGLGDNFKGGMDRQAATIGGAVSNMEDNFQALGRAIWKGGVDKQAKAFVKWISDTTEKISPLAEKYVPQFIDQLGKMYNNAYKLVPVLEAVGATLFGIGAAYVYIKGVMIADMLLKAVVAWRAMDAAQKAAAISGALANATIFAIPIAIGAAVAAVAWFGWQVYKYMTQGEKGIEGLRSKFPWLADAVRFVGIQFKMWWPIIEQIANMIKDKLVWQFNVLWNIIKWAFSTVIIPAFQLWYGWLGKLGGLLTQVYDFWMPKVVSTFYQWKDIFGQVWAEAEKFFAWLHKEFPWLESVSNAIGNALGWVSGVQGANASPMGGSGNVSGAATGLPSWNPGMANAMVNSIKNVRNAAKMCLQAVWMGQQKVLGGKSPITAQLAYQAADQLARSSQFQEITGITPQMLNDPQIKRLLQGSTVIYGRGNGFSKTAGHAEIWDTMGGTAHFGRGAVSLKNRSAAQLQNARFFVPVQQGQGGRGATNIQQVINVNVANTNATPGQITNAVQRGVGNANQRDLSGAATQNRQGVTPE